MFGATCANSCSTIAAAALVVMTIPIDVIVYVLPPTFSPFQMQKWAVVVGRAATGAMSVSVIAPKSLAVATAQTSKYDSPYSQLGMLAAWVSHHMLIQLVVCGAITIGPIDPMMCAGSVARAAAPPFLVGFA